MRTPDNELPGEEPTVDQEQPGKIDSQANDETHAEPVGSPLEAARDRTGWVIFWNVIAIPAVSMTAFFTASMLMVVIAFIVVHGEVNPRMFADSESMKTVSASRIGFLIMVIMPQLALVIPCLVAACFSKQTLRERLSLVRGHWPLWAWCAAALVTPLVGFVSSITVSSMVAEESENLRIMSDIFRGHGETGFLIPLALLIGLTPAICEELLFRGYIQTRLNQRIGPVWGILIASSLFAAFHMDWVHMLAVFPIGLYLGLIAWRSRSLFPAMLGHFVNNAISVVMVVLSPQQEGAEPSIGLVLFLLVVFANGFTGLVFTAVAVWKFPPASFSVAPMPSPTA